MTGLSRAALASRAQLKDQHPSWTLRVSPDRFPKLHAAIDIVSHDSGGGAGHPYHCIDPSWAPYLADLEAALATLSEDDLETFCIGEASESEAIAARSDALKTASALLEEWFDSEPESPT